MPYRKFALSGAFRDPNLARARTSAQQTGKEPMMFKRLAKRNKVLTATMSVLMIGTAFTTPGGCTVTVDEQMVQQVFDWLDYVESSLPGAYTGGDGIGPGWEDGEQGPCLRSGA
jgi:hypothetical protein